MPVYPGALCHPVSPGFRTLILMALTTAFRETVYKRAQRDGAFRKALLTEAVNAYLGGDEATGKAVLRDVINATIGFEPLE
jgi:hypothetical protein